MKYILKYILLAIAVVLLCVILTSIWIGMTLWNLKPKQNLQLIEKEAIRILTELKTIKIPTETIFRLIIWPIAIIWFIHTLLSLPTP